MDQRRTIVRAAELLAVALVGGAVALGGAAALGKLGKKTTVEQINAPASTSVSLAPAHVSGLTPEAIYKRDAPGVVQITATTVTTSPADPFGFTLPQKQTEESLGSGFVIDKAGHIITNYHVISGAQKVQVSFTGGDQITASVVGKDPSTDVAVLKIDTHARALTPLALGDSDAVRVGDEVYAIGIGFAVPINTVRTVAAQLIKTGKVDHPFLGISILPIDKQLAQLFNLPTKTGLLVAKVDPGSGAAKAGLRAGHTNVIVQGTSYPLGGDIIVAVDGKPVATFEQLRDSIARKKPGDSLALQLYRHGQKQTVHVKLGNAPK